METINYSATFLNMNIEYLKNSYEDSDYMSNFDEISDYTGDMCVDPRFVVNF